MDLVWLACRPHGLATNPETGLECRLATPDQ